MKIRRPFSFSKTFARTYCDFWRIFIKDRDLAISLLKRDPALFIETCIKIKTKDANDQSALAFFELYDKQRETLKAFHDAYHNHHELVVVKSRQVGLSWLMCAFSIWLALFHNDQIIIFTTKKADDLHKIGSVKSLLGKVEEMIKYLPIPIREMISPTEKIEKNFTKNHLKFKATNSEIIGVTGGEGARGATANAIFNDEFAFQENQQQVLDAVASASKCNFFVSTLNSPQDVFDQLRQSEIPTIRFSWRDDPRIGDQEVFKKKYIGKFGQANFDRELDMQYNTSDQLYVFPPSWLSDKKSLVFKLDERSNKKNPIIGGLDVAAFGDDFNVLVIRQGPKILHIEQWGHKHSHESVKIVKDRIKTWKIDYIAFDEIGVGTGIKSEIHRLSESKGFPIPAYAINVGQAPSDHKVEGRDAKDQYTNFRDELHWGLRQRVRKTREGGYPVSELILLPNDDILLKEMAIMTYEEQGSKIKVVSKKELRKVGHKSPNRLDALLLTFCHEKDDSAQKKRAAHYARMARR